jgi:hypothetical protein
MMLPTSPCLPRSHALRRAATTLAACLLAACAEYLGTSFSQIVPPEIAGVEPAAGARCALEAVNGAPAGAPWRVSRQHRIHVKGWALDGATLSSSDWVVVRLTQPGGAAHFFAVTWARGTNDEAVRELGSGPGIARAGFDLAATLQQVPPGTYDIDLIVGAPTGPAACSTGRQLVAV